MSAPHTDLEREARKSKWPMIGMGLAVLFGVGAIIFWLFYEVAEAPATDEPTQDAPDAQDLVPPSQEGLGSVPAPEGVEPREVEPAIVTPTIDE